MFDHLNEKRRKSSVIPLFGGRELVGADLLGRKSFVPPEIRLADDTDQFPNRAHWSPTSVVQDISLHTPAASAISSTTLNAVRLELREQSVCGADTAVYLMDNQEQIPVAWQSYCLCFWGTIFTDKFRGLWVASMFYHYDQWHLVYSKPAARFLTYRRALILAN